MDSTLSLLQITAIQLMGEQRLLTPTDLRYVKGMMVYNAARRDENDPLTIMIIVIFKNWDYLARVVNTSQVLPKARIAVTFAKDHEGLLTGEVQIGHWSDTVFPRRVVILEHLKGL